MINSGSDSNDSDTDYEENVRQAEMKNFSYLKVSKYDVFIIE